MENVGLDKELAVRTVPTPVKAETDQGSMIIFTDGSYLQQTGVGASTALTANTRSKAFGRADGITNYETEVMALSLGLIYLLY